jgi:hypothetical protein
MAEKKVGITEGVLLAGIPLVGYWLAYLYQRGYAAYFDLPSAYVEIDTSSVLAAVIGMSAALLVMHSFLEAFYIPIKRMPRVIKIKVIHAVFLVVFYASCAVVFRWPATTFLLYGGPIFLIYLLVQFALPLLWNRDVEGYIAKLEADHKIDQSIPKVMDFYSEKFGDQVVVGLVVLYFVSLIAFFAGSYDAKISKQFMVVSQGKELVVLKQFGGNYVAAELNRKTKQVVQNFRLIPISQPNLQLTYEIIGPLEPVDRATPENY